MYGGEKSQEKHELSSIALAEGGNGEDFTFFPSHFSSLFFESPRECVVCGKNDIRHVSSKRKCVYSLSVVFYFIYRFSIPATLTVERETNHSQEVSIFSLFKSVRGALYESKWVKRLELIEVQMKIWSKLMNCLFYDYFLHSRLLIRAEEPFNFSVDGYSSRMRERERAHRDVLSKWKENCYLLQSIFQQLIASISSRCSSTTSSHHS